jgi:hypothetical protein
VRAQALCQQGLGKSAAKTSRNESGTPLAERLKAGQREGHACWSQIGMHRNAGHATDHVSTSSTEFLIYWRNIS